MKTIEASSSSILESEAAGNGPFVIRDTKPQFERALQEFVERAPSSDKGGESYRMRMPILFGGRVLRRRLTEKERRLLPRGGEWETITNIAEAEAITLTCDPFQGLTLGITEKEAALWVVIVPETYTEAIAEPLPPDDIVSHVNKETGVTVTPVAIITDRKRKRHADPEAHAALSAWLRSLETAEPTPAEARDSPIPWGATQMSAETDLTSIHTLVALNNLKLLAAVEGELQRHGLTLTLPTGKGNAPGKPGRKPTYKIQKRAGIFKPLKDKHPQWAYHRVATEAMEIHSWMGEISGETVRNAYRAMGWKWERADRVR